MKKIILISLSLFLMSSQVFSDDNKKEEEDTSYIRILNCTPQDKTTRESQLIQTIEIYGGSNESAAESEDEINGKGLLGVETKMPFWGPPDYKFKLIKFLTPGLLKISHTTKRIEFKSIPQQYALTIDLKDENDQELSTGFLKVDDGKPIQLNCKAL